MTYRENCRRPTGWCLCLSLALWVCSISGCRDKPPARAKQPNIRPAVVVRQPVTTKIRFDDVTARTGIDFTPVNGEEQELFSIVESVGTGAALADFDRDGNVDLFACGGGTFDLRARPVGRPAALFQNRGDFQFAEVTAAACVPDVPFYSHAAIAGDYNNDGFADLVLTGYGGLMLLENNGDGTFSDATARSGLSDTSWSTAAGWGDFDGDGRLDLFVVRYVNWSTENNPRCPQFGERDVCPPERFQGLSDSMYFSRGDGTFRDVTKEAGIVDGGNGLGLLLADVDRDGDLDAYVANDASPNFLYLNDGAGKLREAGVASGTAFGEDDNADGSMGVDLGDFDNDGLPDLWVTNFEKQMFALYRNAGAAVFRHASSPLGIGRVPRTCVGFGTVAFDADLDGDEDIFAANGHVRRRPASGLVSQQPLLLENRDGAAFLDVAEGAGEYLQSSHRGRGVAAADLDGDDDEDLVVTHLNEPLSVLSNTSADEAPSIRVQLVGTRSSRDAVGATITLRCGDRQQIRQITGGGSYLCTGSLVQVFGLGPHEAADELRVDWPSGRTSVRQDVGAGSQMLLIEP